MAGELAQSYVRRVAVRKAMAVAASKEETVLSADTTVVVDGQILGKPNDAEDAARMLRLLQGRTHEVITGFCLRKQNQIVMDAESTMVRFVAMTEEEIAAYVATGEPMDKAGAYAIQGNAAKYIDRIEGCYWNVVGLPIAKVYFHLRKLGSVA